MSTENENYHLEGDIESNYQPPPQKTIEEIVLADQEDESLRKYKEALLGAAQSETIIVAPDDPRKVIVKKLALCVPDRDDMELDLTEDLSKLKKQVKIDLFVIVINIFDFTNAKIFFSYERYLSSKKVYNIKFESILLFNVKLFMVLNMYKKHIEWVYRVSFLFICQILSCRRYFYIKNTF